MKKRKLIDAEDVKDALCKECIMGKMHFTSSDYMCSLCTMKETIDSIPERTQCDTDQSGYS